MTDLTAPYLDHRQRLVSLTAVDELEQLARSGSAAAPATSPVQDGTEAQSGNLAVRTAKDIGKGLTVEAPRAVAAGVRDAIQSTIDMGDELGTWVEQAANLPGIKVSAEGIEFVGGEELQTLDRPDLKLPGIKPPKTVTGGMVKGVTQFLTGMVGANKALKLAGIGKAAGAAGYARSALQGAMANFAAFDPHQQRLSNLIQQFPALGNPVTEYLASDPDDNAAEGRFKNALEGLTLGVLSDGFFKGVKMLRAARNAQLRAKPVLEPEPAGLADDAFRELGDDTAEQGSRLVRKRPPAPSGTGKTGSATHATPEDVVAAAAKGDQEGKLFINFARIDTDDDVKRVMREMVERRREVIEAGRRGKQSFKEIELNAQQLDAWDALTARREGQPLNAEQSLAARQLWVSSTEKLTQLAQAAADAPSEANLFAFRKMLAVHDAVQGQVIAARTETARALASWRIPAGGSQERLRDVVSALDAGGGPDVARELATRVAALGRAGLVKEIDAVVQKTAYARTRDAVIEGWINGLLSNPKTHVVNVTSNASVAFLRMAERSVAARIRQALGDQGGVELGEATAQWHGLTGGIKDAFRYARKAAMTGETGYGLNKVELPREPAISSQALKLSSSGWLGRGVDVAGQVARVPGRALAAEDEFFKTVGYRMELHAQALRSAADDVAAGRIAKSDLARRMAEVIDSPPENIRMAAVDAATYQTFTQTPGEFAKNLSRLTSKYPAAKVILPFIRTPANILRFTFERTPLAPLMSTFRANYKAGGARQQLALAQAGLGSMAMFAMADYAMNGQVTGRGPPEASQRAALMRQGWKPYSVKVGDKWVTYNRLDPVGSLIGMSADMTETLMHTQHELIDEGESEGVVAAGAIAFAGNLVNKTYLSGLSSAIEALNDPTRYAESWLERLSGSVVPAGVAQGTRIADPYVHEVNGMVDAMRARLPGFSDDLPGRLDVWGRPLTYESGLGVAFDLFAPVMTSSAEKEPIDTAILENGVNLNMPARHTSFDGVTVDLGKYPGAYMRYAQLAGNELQHPAWGMGAKDLLNAIVTGKHPLSQIYEMRSAGPDGGKDHFIRDTVRQYREYARKQLLDEYPDLRDEIERKKQAQRELALPVQ